LPDLAVVGAVDGRGTSDESSWEGERYWSARREWEELERAEVPSATILRSVSAEVYRGRLARKRDGGEQGLAGMSLASAGWKSLGPTNGAGRVRDYAFSPDGSKLYAATANGGIWLLTRSGGPGGDFGNPVNLTDDLPLLTFGAVAVAPSAPNVVYAATGEQAPASSVQVAGLGTVRSTDGGVTWSFNTTSVTGGVSSVIPSRYSFDLDVHPTNPDDVLLASADGIFRSKDGGKTWVNRLPSAGIGVLSTRQAVNFARSPSNPNVVWAGLWGGLAVSVDAGETWQVRQEDIAERVGFAGTAIRSLVAIAPSDSSRLYWFVAGYVAATGKYSQVGVFRSDDGGATWRTALGAPSGLRGYPALAGTNGWIFLALAVDPSNPDRVFAGGLDVWRSDNGGLGWTQVSGWTLPEENPRYCHADINVFAFEPGRSTLWVGSDGGLYRSADGRSFSPRNAGVVARMFSSVAQHPTDLYRLYAGTQDNGTMSLRGDNPTAWSTIYHGDGYDCAVNYQDPQVVYITNYNGATSRAADGGEREQSFRKSTCAVTERDPSQCAVPAVTSFRSRLGMDPVNPLVLFTMTDRIYTTENGATDPSDWRPVFGEYFCADGPSGQPCPDAGKRYASCSSLSAHPKLSGRVAFGTAAGYVVYTLNGFQNAPTLNLGSQVNAIAWDPADANAFFVGLESARELVAGQGSHVIWRIGGLDREPKTMTPASAGIGVTVSYAGEAVTYFAPVDSLAFSPTNPDVLVAGTKYGIFRSSDKGRSWAAYGDDFPAAWVSALLFTPDGTRLRAATWGRGMWEIDLTGVPAGPKTPPVAAFSARPDTPKPGQAVKLSDQSQGGASAWAWDFGDGTSSASQNPKKVFAAAGDYRVTLTASNALGSSTATKTISVSHGSTGTGAVYTYLLPIVLTTTGAGGAFYTSELTLTNRSGRPVDLTFRATGTFDAASTYSLPPGQQVHPDTFAFLRDRTGMSVPTGNVTASLRIEVSGAANLAQFGAQVRVTTPSTDALRAQGVTGRFGLAFLATPLGRAASTEAVVYGLQQTSSPGSPGTRSNLACVNAGGGPGGFLRLEATYYGGTSGAAHPSKDVFDLGPFRWEQKSQPLAARGLDGGFAVVRRVSGADQFVCYGVLNDNLNGDGAFVQMVPNDVPAQTPAAIVPVILESGGYTSELTVANRTSRDISGLFIFLPSADPTPQFGFFNLPPEAQYVSPNIVKEMRDVGFDTLPGTVGSVLVQFLEGSFRLEESDTQDRIPATDAYLGVRTTTTRAGGKLGLAYGMTPIGEAADTEAWVYGLQQTGVRGQEGGTRSNLAVVHAFGGNVEDLGVSVSYFGPDGAELGPEPECNPCTLKPGQWHQFSAPLQRFGVANGYARIRRVSGTDQFLAYGVLNDQGNDDGSYVPMTLP
jgi:PKD repeat protein